MDNQKKTLTIDQVPANPKLVESLAQQGFLTDEAKAYALKILNPKQLWGVWISRLFLIFGVTLVLSGIIFFIAYNWADLASMYKFIIVQAAILISLLGAWRYKLDSLTGKIYLFAASFLVGVFLAVFGQVYQTGADAYQLFMGWALLILGWTIISNFSIQWVLWLVLMNLWFIFWWEQTAYPASEHRLLIYVILISLNGTALFLKEALEKYENLSWLQNRGLRLALVITCLAFMLVSAISFIADEKFSLFITISGLTGIIGHGVIYFTYRYLRFDLWSLVATVLSSCFIFETLLFRLTRDDNVFFQESVFFFLMTIGTIGIFTLATVYIKELIKIERLYRD